MAREIIKDPKVIERLNQQAAMQSRMSQSSQPSAPKEPQHSNLLQSAGNFGAGIGGGLSNFGGNAFATMTGQASPERSELGGEGLAGKLGRFTGEALPYVAATELSPALGARLGAGPALSRIAGGGAYGALDTPDSPGKGFGLGAGLQAAFEGPGQIAGYLKSVGQAIHPTDFANSQVEQLQKGYKFEKGKSKNIYGSVEKAYGDLPISGLGKIEKAFEDNSPWITSAADKLKKEFLNDPTFKNGHKLQSQLGKDAAKNAGEGGANQNYATVGKELGELVSDAILNELRGVSPKHAQLYETATEHYRDTLLPYEASPGIYSLASGLEKNVSPKDLNARLERLAKKGFDKSKSADARSILPEYHDIRDIHSGLSERLKNASALDAMTGGKIPWLSNLIGGGSDIISQGLKGAGNLSRAAGNVVVPGAINEIPPSPENRGRHGN